MHKYVVVDGGKVVVPPTVTKVVSIIDKSGPLLGWAINSMIDTVRAGIEPDVAYSSIYLEQLWDVARRISGGKKNEAAAIGTATHRAIEAYLRESILPPENTPIGRAVASIIVWLEKTGYKIEEVERRIYSRRYGYSGTLDLVASGPDGVVLFDWKTSKAVYPEFWLQTAAYAGAYREETGRKIDKRKLVRIDKVTGELEIHEKSTLRDDLAAFRAALTLYKHLRKE